MVHRLVDGVYLSRAKKIPDSAVLNWGITKENPPLLYAVIKGSRSDPYSVVIDMEKKILGHDCPVFENFIKSKVARSQSRRRRYNNYVSSAWCKHFGKLLLLAGDKLVDNIVNSHKPTDLTYENKNLNKWIENLNLKNLAQSDVSANSITENLQLLEHNIHKNIDNIDLELELLDQILQEFEKIDEFSKLQLSYEWLDQLKKSSITSIDDRLESVFTTILQEAYNEFFATFWVSSVYRRMEKAYLLRQVGKSLHFDYYDLDINLDATGIPLVERQDGAIVINALISNLKLKYKTMKQIGITYKKQEIINRYKMLTNELRMKGTGNDKFKQWLNERLHFSNIESRNEVNISEFLIYLLTIASYKPKRNIVKKASKSTSSIDKEELAHYPVLKFCIDRIKTSHREYITNREIKANKRFFNYLKGNSISPEYLEKKRERIEDYNLPNKGIIIQWGIPSGQSHFSTLQTTYESKRILIDNRSTVSPKIQPFDLVVCRLPLKIEDEFSRVAYPEVIISPKQAIKLIKKGMNVISDVLPWNTIYRYFNNKVLSNIDIKRALQTTEDHYFIYGALELKEHLETISDLSTTNIDDAKLKEIADKIKLVSKFDEKTEETALSIINAEGKELQSILDLLNLSDKDKSRLVLNALNKVKSKKELREELTTDLIKKIVKSDNSGYIFKNLREMEFENYPIFDYLSKMIKSELIRLNKRFDRRPPTKKILRKNLVGLSILNTLEIKGDGKLSEVEKEAIVMKLEQVFSNTNLQ